MLIRCLIDEGIAEFERFLRLSALDAANRDCAYLLTDLKYTEPFALGQVEVERRHFGSRRDFAVYIDSCFQAAGIVSDVDIRGMWEWLSVFYFEQLRPPGMSSGTDVRRFILQSSTGQRRHRHLLREPYMLYRRYRHTDGTELDLVLCDELWNHGDVVENLAARSRLRNSSGALRIARMLYFDPTTGRTKRGTRNGDGGHRHFARFLRNLPPQFDLSSISEDTILALLPLAFTKWRDHESPEISISDEGEPFGVNDSVPDTLELAGILQDSNSRSLSVSKRRIRQDFFRASVLGAYENRCAISRIGLVHTELQEDISYEVEASHVIPVARGGRDLVPNGLALNRSLHWAFDHGMVWVDSDMRVNVSKEVQNDRRNEWLRGFEGRNLWVPDKAQLRPNSDALQWHAEHVAIR